VTAPSVLHQPRTLIDLIPRPADRTMAITRDIAFVVGFACLTAAAAQIRFNLSFTPVPLSGQTFAVLLAGTTLGFRRGIASQALYWVAGIFMPIAWYADDSSGSSISQGWNIATGTTFGYFMGFVAAAAVVGYLAERGQDREFATSLPAMLAGSAVIYVFGAAWLAYDLNIPLAAGDTNAIELGVTPFLIGDLIKLAIAGVLAPVAWKFANSRR